MRKISMILIPAILLILTAAPATAQGLPVTDVHFIHNMLLTYDPDFELFDKTQLCTAFIWLIENDGDKRVVDNAVANLWHTADERSIPYIIKYLDNDDLRLDCLFELGYFSTQESCNALLGYIGSDDEFERNISARALGRLDYTESDEMWNLHSDVLDALRRRMTVEKEDWIQRTLNDSFIAVDAQVLTTN
jgi:HEAT repeat protein